ncbi:CRTAC1 family protein [Crateriforma conspicua]|uniref:CRTAC1 family protein n=1 Tax=Crateriforma conspicua TaxID=2527996 RepID=UPI00118B5555|nr:CRTAC1 family protein [Crateriforma conspicua]QDV63669.1 FG-GAP repeat protein [Crateriforma conspicua]
MNRKQIRIASATLFSALILLAGTTGCDRQTETPETTERRPESFRTKYRALIRSGNLAAADELVVAEMVRRPDDVDVLRLAAELSAERGQWDEAAQRYQAFIESGATVDDKIRQQWFDARCAAGDVMQCIAELQQESKPTEFQRRQLSRLAAIVGDVWLSQQAMLDLLSDRRIDPLEAALLTCFRQPRESNEDFIKAALDKHPTDQRPSMALAVRQWLAQDRASAIEILEPIVQQHADYRPAIGLLGFLYADSADFQSLRELLQEFSPDSIDRAEYWYAFGVAKQQAGANEAAIGAFAKSVDDPFLGMLASGRMATVLAAAGKLDSAKAFTADDATYKQLCMAQGTFLNSGQQSQKACLEIAELLATLGREREVQFWTRLASSRTSEPVDDLTAQTRSINRAARTSERNNLLASLRQQYPVVASELEATGPSDVADTASGRIPSVDFEQLTPVRLIDEAKQRGLEFTFNHGERDGSLGRWILHITGGGVAARDFDRDGWPDILMTQAGSDPRSGGATETAGTSDALFWNHDGTFSRAPDWAIDSRGYGQGVAAGDVNGDGFDDLFIATVDRNRLWINRGDGTFRDATEQAQMTSRQWSCSVAMADLNGDGLSDLIETNYTEKPASLDLPCYDDDGELTACMPLAFGPTPDYLWLSNGDGTFRNDGDWDEPSRQGRGLGVLVADVDASGELDVLVANDQSANHLWQRRDDRWVDMGTLRGLAVGSVGRPQGCMGIAWGDPDDDGDMDLMVTNYTNEHNNFFVQQSAGHFIDRAAMSGMTDISLVMLGFGVALTDLDVDGRDEVFIANGLVNKNTDPGLPFKQPAQVLRTSGIRLWDDLRTEGTYLEEPHVGRAIGLADFNRDGLTDIAITHLGEPAGLLINHSDVETSDRWIAFDLVANNSDRDAVGSTVTVKTNLRDRVIQRVAGYGYQSTHDRVLKTTLASGEKIESVQVRWRGGGTDDLGPLATGSVWQLRQGESDPILLGGLPGGQ